MNYPFDDKEMKYNKEQHRYILTNDGVINGCGINLSMRFQNGRDDKPTTQVDRFLDFISRHVYNFIYARIPAANKNIIQYVLAKTGPARDVIKQAMLNEVEYALSEGAFWNKSGVNIARGSAMDLSTLRDTRRISADTYDLLNTPIDGVPFTILYRGIIINPRYNMTWREDY